MTRTQLVFSSGCGSLLMAAGAALALNGVADWGLCLVGALITGVTVMSTRPSITRTGALAPARLSPVES